MYKILITTKYYANGNGVSVHSVVVEFGDKGRADMAALAVNEQRDISYQQKAIALY